MNQILIVGTTIVNLALIAYTIAIIKFYKTRLFSNAVLTFFALGVFLDITATIFMVIGSSKGLITLHGLIGYSALLAMLIELLSIIKFRRKNCEDSNVGVRLKYYSYFAYTWWVLAYITGAVIVALRH